MTVIVRSNTYTTYIPRPFAVLFSVIESEVKLRSKKNLERSNESTG